MSEAHTCCKIVYSKGLNFSRGHTCGKNAKFERNGKYYCGMHDPVAKAAKDKERSEKWDAQWKAARERAKAPANRIKELESEVAALREKLDIARSCLQDLVEDAPNLPHGITPYRRMKHSPFVLIQKIDTAIQQSKDSAPGEKK